MILKQAKIRVGVYAKDISAINFFIFLFSSGCVNPFAPGLDESPDGNFGLITDQKTVDGVLQNFKYAYTFRDSTLYGKTLANNFLFLYKDYDKGVDVFGDAMMICVRLLVCFNLHKDWIWFGIIHWQKILIRSEHR